MSLLSIILTVLTSWQFAMEKQPHQMPDTAWLQVSVPHDWAITTPFDRQNDLQQVTIIQNGETTPSWKTGRSGGLNWMGAAWYKTQVMTPALSRDSIYYLLFDGAMARAEVYVNGQKVMSWPYGYNSFYVDITPYLRPSNTIAVRLENLPEQSRWYPGAGLYRNVHWISKARTHIPIWGTSFATVSADSISAVLSASITVQNITPQTRVQTDILYQNKVIATIHGLQGQTQINQPLLWSPQTPYLYIARTTVWNGDQQMDQHDTPIGIRTISYLPNQGFALNGQRRKFQGVCLHHDLGPLGAAVNKDALRHQLTLLKDMGCDAIRTTHNMPAPELVELCEQMGLMLVVESFDVWKYAKCKNDYSTFFTDWAERDIVNMIRHYRNSPAVVMWSVGNEVWDQVQTDGVLTAQYLQSICHREDPIRPVTCGMDQVKDVIYNGFARVFDIPGFNYRTSRYVEANRQLPNKLVLGSETASTVSSRGSYHYPVAIQPDAIHSDHQSSGYDVEYCAWSGLPDQDFQLQDDYDWTIGQFVWTGVDYLGEPSPYDTDAWPAHSSYFGIIDLASLPKDRYYLYRSQWNKQHPTLHVLPHWTHPDRVGEITPVYVYTSYPSAELFVNGVSQGRLRFATADEASRLAQGEAIEGVSPLPTVGSFDIPAWGSAPRPELLPRYRLMWPDVTYQPGEMRVVAYNEQDQPVAEQTIRTASQPYALQVEWANQNEPTQTNLRYLTVRAVDKNGNLCPNADNVVTLTTHKARFIGAANGDPTCLYPMQQPTMPLFHGQATFIVQWQPNGKVILTADKLKKCILK